MRDLRKLLAGVFGDWLLISLFALGLTLPMLYILELTRWAPMAACINGGISLAFAACRRMESPGSKRLCRLGMAGALLLWLVLRGASDGIECLRGMSLQLSGDTSVMPLIASRSVPVVAVAGALLAGMVSMRAAGGLPGIMMSLLSLLLLWLSGAQAGLVYALPGLAACLIRMALSRREGLRMARVVPWVMGIILISFLLVPSGGITVPALKQTADSFKKQVMDRFFFTQPRTIFSLADLGWYPMGSSQLGGTPEPEDGLVLVADTTRRTWLRGCVKDTYTGHGWEDRLGSRRYLYSAGSMRTTRDNVLDAALPRAGRLENGRVMVTVARRVSSTLLLPQRLRQLSVSGDMVLYFNDASEVFVTRDLTSGDSYTAEAPLMAAGDPGLREMVEACAKVDDPRYEQVLRTYITLPSHLGSQVRELARAAAGTGSDYDRAMNIMHWLQQNCTYTMEVAAPDPDADFVSQFLLGDRRGYCTYFATAMTVMCRMAGIPARYVEGFLADPDAEGRAWVTGRQGHAWTEVYLSGFGWLTFDATPQESVSGTVPQTQVVWVAQETPRPTASPSPTPSPTPKPQEPEQDEPEEELQDEPEEDEPEQDEEPDDDENEEEPEPEKKTPPIPWGWVCGGLVLLLLLALLWVRGFSRRPQEQADHAATEEERCQVWLDALTDALEAMGLQRIPSESPLAWMDRLTGQGLPKLLNDVGALQTVLSYSHRVPTANETAVARKAYLAVERRMTRRQRLRMHIHRLL